MAKSFLKALPPHTIVSGFNTVLWGSRIMEAHGLLHLTWEATVVNTGLRAIFLLGKSRNPRELIPQRWPQLVIDEDDG